MMWRSGAGRGLLWALAGLVVAGTAPLGARGAEPAERVDQRSDEGAEEEHPVEVETEEERLERLEATVAVVVDEIDRFRKVFAVPEEGELVSFSGLGPAASKVYQRDRGLSIGGYGEVRFRGEVGDRTGATDVFDALRAVLYVGYKFNDWIVFNSEFEFEHGGTGGGGSVSTEFLTLDFLLCDCFNLRAGLLLVPMGFINEIHEPTFFYGAARPEVERQIMPSTWRENGAGVFGSLGDIVDYRFYVVNGFDATGFDDSGLRGGRQKGSEALSDQFAFVGRVDVEPLPWATLGASVYTGKSGQNQTLLDPSLASVPIPDSLTTVWEVHAQVRLKGFHFRGLYTQAHVDDSGALSAALTQSAGSNVAVAKRMIGGYFEAAYDLLPVIFPETTMSLEPFYRFEHIDTMNERAASVSRVAGENRDIHTVGLQFKPHPQVVIKVDYRHQNAALTQLPDEVEAGIGFVF